MAVLFILLTGCPFWLLSALRPGDNHLVSLCTTKDVVHKDPASGSLYRQIKYSNNIIIVLKIFVKQKLSINQKYQ